MLVTSIRLGLALIVIATVPYTLTVATVVALWFGEKRYAISGKITRLAGFELSRWSSLRPLQAMPQGFPVLPVRIAAYSK